MAMGSLFEVETQITICERLGFFERGDVNDILQLLNIEAKMINSLISKIKTVNN